MQDGGGYEAREINCGVPQGSVLGPAMWNLFFDGLLRKPLPEGARLIGFADDITLVVTRHTTEEGERVAWGSLAVISEWMDVHGLTLAAEKTKAIFLSRRKAYRQPQV